MNPYIRIHALIKLSWQEYGCKTMILSDANDVYINEILDGYGLSQYVDKVITNKGYWEECGDKTILRVKPYHCNTTCSLCPTNLCKGTVLR